MTADRGQTISRPSCLTVTVTRFFIVSDYFRGTIPTVIKLVRDIKRLFVLLFYHIAVPFATNAAVSKTQETATPVDSLATHRTFSYLSAWGWWESGFVCQRRAAILRECKGTSFNKIPVRPRGGADL